MTGLSLDQHTKEATPAVGVTHAWLVAVLHPGDRAAESLDELALLAESAGLIPVGRSFQSREQPDPRYYLGRGKLDESIQQAQQAGADLLLFDDELTPAQLRNIDERSELAVLDRTGLILDIFAHRAQTREGQLQVEMAQNLYRLPRLAGQGRAFSRLGGGIGTRGPGETKLESDRRLVRSRIAQLRADLEAVRRERGGRRHSRQRAGLPLLSLVGYTNAGKTTLRHQLEERFAATGQSVRERSAAGQARLFDTLDPTTRRLRLPNGQEVLLTDTVGFIRKLPHDLVAAFRATLEEIGEADLVLHVVDAANPQREEQMQAVYDVLAEIEAVDRPSLLIFNKCDLLSEEERRRLDPLAIQISARTGEGLDRLVTTIDRSLQAGRLRATFQIPYNMAHLIDLMHKRSRVLRSEYGEEGVTMEVELEEWLASRIATELARGRSRSPERTVEPDGRTGRDA